MDLAEEIAKFKARRDKAFREMDMNYAREMLPNASNDEVRLIAMHKARYDCTSIEPEYRLESKRWLAERSYAGTNGVPLLPGDLLPG